MTNEYKQLYNSIIGKKFRAAVISYSPRNGKYQYRGYSHHAKEGALDDIADLLIDNMFFYAFSENEVLKLIEDLGVLEDLRAASLYAYKQRLPKRTNAKTDGIMGEVLLDLFIQLESLDTKKLIARAKHTEINSRKEITGYDALYFSIDENGIFWWLGQAKAGQKGYCKEGIREDLLEKYKKEYFADTAYYVADKNEAEELSNLLKEINQLCFLTQIKKIHKKEKIEKLFELLRKYDVKVKIPCLVTYSMDIYSDKDRLKDYIEAEIQDIVNTFDQQIFPIEVGVGYEIIFFIMPVENVNYIRERICDLKKEAQ